LRRSSVSNHALGKFTYEFNPKSNLSFGASYDLRDYQENASFAGRLSNQNRIAGDLEYRRQIGEHGSWKAHYRFVRNQIKDLGDSNTHNWMVEYSHQLGPRLVLSFGGGPALTEEPVLARNVTSYSAAASLVRSFRRDRLSLFFDRRAGDASGYGHVSNTQSIGIGLHHPIHRAVSVSFTASAFDSRPLVPLDQIDPLQRDTFQKYRGVSGAVDLAFALNKHLQLSGGAAYNKLEGINLLTREQKQIYAALRYRVPELWRFAR